MAIDLRKCTEGDMLISSLGAILYYVRPTTSTEYLDHLVKYEDDTKGYGTRTHDGHVFKAKRMPEIDHDIVAIVPLHLLVASIYKLGNNLPDKDADYLIKLHKYNYQVVKRVQGILYNTCGMPVDVSTIQAWAHVPTIN